MAIEYCLDFELFYAINDVWWGRRGWDAVFDWVRGGKTKFHNGEDGVQESKGWGQCQLICMMTYSSFYQEGAKASMTQFA
jgi:hypothetical protein